MRAEEEVVEDGRDGPAVQSTAEGGVGVGVEVGQHGADAEADGALLVGLVRVEGKRRRVSESGVHLVKPDVGGRASQ